MELISLLKRLIAYPSITPQECGIYAYVKTILPEFKTLEFNKNGVKNLFLYKEFSVNANSHLCFAGHIDVVPPGDGWESDPFVPCIKDGYLYGRGAQDMKGGVSAFLSAIREFCDAKRHFNGILSVLLTSDEEGEAIFGTKYALECLKEQNLLPHFALVAEPTCVEKFGDMVKIGRRGSINGKIHIQGKQGHVAYPSKCVNPIHLFAKSLSKLADYPLDTGNAVFEPSRIILTDIRSGMEVVNVTPNDLRLMFNVRNSTQTSLQDVESYVRDVLQGLPYTLELKQSSKPFLTDSNNAIVQKLVTLLKAQNGFAPELSTSGGTSDARYFAEFGVNVVEFGVCNDSIHSLNERVKIVELEALQKIFLHLLESF